jgi:hypothetical protein
VQERPTCWPVTAPMHRGSLTRFAKVSQLMYFPPLPRKRSAGLDEAHHLSPVHSACAGSSSRITGVTVRKVRPHASGVGLHHLQARSTT